MEERYGISKIVADTQTVLIEYLDKKGGVGGAVKIPANKISPDLLAALTSAAAGIIKLGLIIQCTEVLAETIVEAEIDGSALTDH